MRSKNKQAIFKRTERGMSLVELSASAVLFFVTIFGVMETSRLVWTHNALTDATRIGARYASISAQNATNVKNMVVYGKTNPSGSDKPVVSNLTTSNVQVTYSGFGVKQGTVEVKITGYQFSFFAPFNGANSLTGGGASSMPTTIIMPAYKTTLTSESAGQIPLVM